MRDDVTAVELPTLHGRPHLAALLRARFLGGRTWAQLLRFGIVGASSYALNLATYWLVLRAGGGYHAAAVVAFLLAVTNSFIGNRHWTFSAGDGRMLGQGARFLSVSLFSLGVNLLMLSLLIGVGGLPKLPAQALALIVAAPINFVGNKLWSFRA